MARPQETFNKKEKEKLRAKKKKRNKKKKKRVKPIQKLVARICLFTLMKTDI